MFQLFMSCHVVSHFSFLFIYRILLIMLFLYFYLSFYRILLSCFYFIIILILFVMFYFCIFIYHLLLLLLGSRPIFGLNLGPNWYRVRPKPAAQTTAQQRQASCQARPRPAGLAFLSFPAGGLHHRLGKKKE